MIANTYVVHPFNISEVKVIALKGDMGYPTQVQVNNAVTEYFEEHPDRMIPTNGTYPDMAVGNLLSPYPSSDLVPYYSRTSHGIRVEDEIVGGTVVWNQLVSLNNGTSTSQGVTYTRSSDGTVTCSNTSTGSSYYNAGSTLHIENHIVFICGCPSGGSSSSYYLRDGYTSLMYDTGNGLILKAKANLIAQISIASGTNANGLVFKPQIIDLTLLFGSTIADYIYSLEQGTAGAGVAFFRSLFPKSYYAYDAGSMQSVQVAGRKIEKTGEETITYPLDSSLTLRGILKKDANNKLYFDGDTYESDGTVTRKYGERAYQNGDANSDTMITNGTTTIYKLTTPTTESAEPYTNPQIVYDNGTETYLDGATRDIDMIVGHNSLYYPDMVDFLSQIPSAPSTNGTYTLKVTVSGGVPTYSWVSG